MFNNYEILIDRFTTYAQSDTNVSAVFMFGSYTRIDQPADEYSDVDIIMVVDNPVLFLTTDMWMKQMGKYHISFVENTIAGEKARRVLFDDALDVDFLVISKANAEKVLISNEVVSFFKKGYKTIIDKSGLSQHIPKVFVEDNQHFPLTEFEFNNLENDFWFHTVWATKKLLRGELWAAKNCVDTYMKSLLVILIENHSRVKNGMDYNTWHGGRFIDTWADKQVLNELKSAFAHYEKEDIANALKATMQLFHWISIEIAEKLSYEYPYAVEKSATDWIHKMMK